LGGRKARARTCGMVATGDENNDGVNTSVDGWGIVGGEAGGGGGGGCWWWWRGVAGMGEELVGGGGGRERERKGWYGGA